MFFLWTRSPKKSLKTKINWKKKYQKGVYVDIENQYTLVAVKDGSKIKIDDAVSAIVDAGYEVDNIYHNPYGDKIETFSKPYLHQNRGKKWDLSYWVSSPYLHPQAPWFVVYYPW